jgi:hypothetical protein
MGCLLFLPGNFEMVKRTVQVLAFIIILAFFAGVSESQDSRIHEGTLYQLDNDTLGRLEMAGNIYNLCVVSKDPNVFRAEYEAGFIQGHLQKDLIPASRDNSWDGFTLLDPGGNKSIPPGNQQISDVQGALVRNYNYTLNYISNQSDDDLREQMARLAFRLLGIYDGATKNQPKELDFSGKWLPGLDNFEPDELTLNYETSTISFMDIYFLNAISDVWDVVDYPSEMTKCSAFIKKTDSDILLAHSTHTCYLDESMATTYYINGDFLTLNPSPAGIIGSNTDFGYNNKGILFAETTHDTKYTKPKIESLWMFWRSALAEQFADSLNDFFRLISLETSGTYMCGFMVADVKTNEIGLIEMSYKSLAFFKPDDSGGYEVITRPIGLSKEYDRELLQPDYILGVNLPALQVIRDDIRSKDDRPSRRKQFLSQIDAVNDIESAKALITYIDPEDPLSIYKRGDLDIGNTTKPSGSVDAKAVSASMITYAYNLSGIFDANSRNNIFWMKKGTPMFKGKPFIWSESQWKGQKLRGVQDTMDGPWTFLRGYIQ